MKKYDSKNFNRLICQGKLREAVDYLKNFPSKKRLVKKYEAVFESDSPVIRSKNEVINRIDAIFQKYYRNVFWKGMKKEDAFMRLCSRISVFLNYKLPDTKSFDELEQLWENEIEPKIKVVVEKESFHYLGGKTQGYYGPYIWKKTVPKTYRVQLPGRITEYTVNMMKGFISRSWMAFLSFDRIGTGGWAGEDGILNCVWKSYAKEVHTSKNQKSFFSFLSEADCSSQENSHTYASYLLIRNLSRLLFHEDYVNDAEKWKGKRNEVKNCSLRLYQEYPDHTSESCIGDEL